MSAAAEGGCVLIVDDEEDTREVLREVVTMGGCDVLLAANGAEALRLLAVHRPCLIILDVLMPVMNGLETLAALRSHDAYASIPVVMSTSAPERVPVGVPVLPKPIDIAIMWEWMRRSCECGASAPR